MRSPTQLLEWHEKQTAGRVGQWEDPGLLFPQWRYPYKPQGFSVLTAGTKIQAAKWVVQRFGKQHQVVLQLTVEGGEQALLFYTYRKWVLPPRVQPSFTNGMGPSDIYPYGQMFACDGCTHGELTDSVWVECATW
eukprot:TRINITY_DN95591_c0_g1_i1.p2 TRINITY_DN95591_c0_g1~~TRINITY_DN95591_c0_g1_i1.p2  ORF type:complete len:135 (-),score=1.79 TRINITY_DN95591_c0_g1_i1:64-468(-)